jgi:hypothetical protein
MTSSDAPAHILGMSLATVPVQTDDSLAALRGILCGGAEAPARSFTMWSASTTCPGVCVFTSTRLHRRRDPPRHGRQPGTRHGPTPRRRHGPGLGASSEVAAVLTATGCMTRYIDAAYAVAFRLRDDVVELIEAILVTAD